MKKQFLAACLTASVFVLSGCDNQSTETAGDSASEQQVSTPKTPDFEVKAFTRSAWLREQLPDNAFFYARVPSLWDLASYKDDTFKYAHGNTAYLAELEKIRTASSQWFKKGGEDAATLLTLFGSQMDGPSEMVAYSVDNKPYVLMSANVRFSSAAELQALIDVLLQRQVIRQVIEPMTDGAGRVMMDSVPLAYRWDQKVGRLNLLITQEGASIRDLDAALAALKPNATSPMLANEAKMEDSHKGLYFWFDNQQAAPVYTPILPPNAALPLAAAGVSQIESLAASWGVSNGKGRLKYEMKAPSHNMVRQFIPATSNSYPFKVAGDPSFVLALSLPSFEDFKRLEMMGGGLSNPKYQEQKQKASEMLGYPIDDWFKSIGPEVVFVSDDAGEYLAIRLRDEVTFSKILNATKAWPQAEYESRIFDEQEVHHLKLPSMYSAAQDELAKNQQISPLLSDVLTQIGTHIYWQRDGDYLIMADLPQVLFDRQVLVKSKTLEQWLVEEQRQDLSSSTFAFSGNIRNAPRRLYYFYLNMLQAFGDLTHAQQDLFNLPSARQLHLADKGTYGAKLDSSADTLAFEMTFESSPADIALAGEGMATIATIGVLAAVAIPAYQEYTQRAYLTQVYADSTVLRKRVEAFYADSGRYPNAEEARDFYLEEGYGFYFMEVTPDNGTIRVDLKGKSYVLDGEILEIYPEFDGVDFAWYCDGDISESVYPSQCR